MESTRVNGRGPAQLRPVRIQRRYTKHAEGSVLVELGDTRVLCTASLEERVPPFLKDTGRGWVTAEYGMLPRATNTRSDVLQADGGTRTAAITGAFVALHDAFSFLKQKNLLQAWPIRDHVQGTAEGEVFSRAELDKLLELAARGIAELIQHQKKSLGP